MSTSDTTAPTLERTDRSGTSTFSSGGRPQGGAVLPPVPPELQYDLGDPDLNHLAELPGLALMTAATGQSMQECQDRSDLGALFKRECGKAKDFFVGSARKLGAGVPPSDRSRLVRDGATWADDLCRWVVEGMPGPIDFDEWRRLASGLETLMVQLQALYDIAAEAQGRERGKLLLEALKFLQGKHQVEPAGKILDALRNGEPVSEPPPASMYCFRLVGEMWEVRFGEEHGYFRNLTGFRIIAKLLRFPHPTEPMAPADLLGLDADNIRGEHTYQEVLDSEALASYRARLSDLESEIDKAEKNHDKAELGRLRKEQDQLLAEIAKATGKGGQPRLLGPSRPEKKAEDRVRNAIRRARDRIAKSLPGLAQHLDDSMSTGSRCAYRPSTQIDWQLD